MLSPFGRFSRVGVSLVSPLLLLATVLLAPRGASPAALSSGVAQASGLVAQAVDRPLTLALKFVEFSRNGRPVLSRAQAMQVVDGLNAVYAQCRLRMKLEDYQTVDPARYGLGVQLSSPSEMDSVRTPFDTARYLVLIHTDPWNHGPMGPANAWTAMPGQIPAGAVLEAPVAFNSNITAHEIGHYLGLDHARDVKELMNPIIYRSSVRISPAECQKMRTTAVLSRAGALRDS